MGPNGDLLLSFQGRKNVFLLIKKNSDSGKNFRFRLEICSGRNVGFNKKKMLKPSEKTDIPIPYLVLRRSFILFED